MNRSQTGRPTLRRLRLIASLAAAAGLADAGLAAGPSVAAAHGPKRLPPVRPDCVPDAQSATETIRPAASGSGERETATAAAASTVASPPRANQINARADGFLRRAAQEYNVGALVSAEDSAWRGLEQAAEAIDVANPGSAMPALLSIRQARVALTEARQLGTHRGVIDPTTLQRYARSHRSKVLPPIVTAPLSPAVAAGGYFDFALNRLRPVAAKNVRAAHAMDLLAAVYLTRDEPATMPIDSSLCLRRAAASGQPGNADLSGRLGMQLADVGLDREASDLLHRSLNVAHDPVVAETLANVLRRNRIDPRTSPMLARDDLNSPNAQPKVKSMPIITRVDPDQFAKVSPAFQSPRYWSAGGTGATATTPAKTAAATRVAGVPVGYRPTGSAATSKGESDNAPIRSWGARLIDRFKRK